MERGMKLSISVPYFYKHLSMVRKATSKTKLVKPTVLLIADETLKIRSTGIDMYAQAELECAIHEPGTVVMTFESFNLFQYIDEGSITMELDETLNLSGIFEGKLTTQGTNLAYTEYEPPTKWTKVGEGLFNVLYAVGDDDRTSPINIYDNRFCTGDYSVFAGFLNDESVSNELIAVQPDVFRAINHDSFEIGFTHNKCWVKQGNLFVSQPTWGYTSDAILKYGLVNEYTDTHFHVKGSEFVRAVNVVHALSTSSEKGDGRASLRIKEGKLILVSSGNQLGNGSYEIDCQHHGELEFGLSTRRIKNVINNCDSDEITVHLFNVDGSRALIIIGNKTQHFIAEDPGAR
jgi:hypothetical protein